MGNCVHHPNIGEEYVLTLMTNLKANSLFYEDIVFFIETKKKELTSQETKELLDQQYDQYIQLKVETMRGLDEYENKKFFLLLNDFENVAHDKLCNSSNNNNHLESQMFILRKLFSKQYEFNCYHFSLTTLSLLCDLKKDKINLFFEICSKIKRNFTFDDFKLFLYSYLYNNLYTISQSALISLIGDSHIKSDLDYLINNVFTDINIKRFQDSILDDYKRRRLGEVLPSSHVMSKDDFNEIFFDKEFIFSLKELRPYYLNFIKFV